MRNPICSRPNQNLHADNVDSLITPIAASQHGRWVRLIESARQKREQGLIDCALLDYDRAYRLADLCLRTERNVLDAAGRYLVSTAEMLYSLRLAGYRTDMQHLLQRASQALEATRLPLLQTRVAALQAIVGQPLGLIEYWLCQCLGLLSRERTTADAAMIEAPCPSH